MGLGITIGNSSFRDLREQGAYYIDKSALISELQLCEAKLVLLPRPRRFGKTLNLSMLHCFFDMDQQSADLFAGLAVTQDPTAMAQINAYPTVFLSFKNAGSTNWETVQFRLKETLSQVFVQYLTPELMAALSPMEQAFFAPAMRLQTPVSELTSSLLHLTRVLHRITGKQVYLLIDEYDMLLHKGRAHGFYPEAVTFLREFLGAALKDNEHLHRAVITGILRVAKESIYSGLNNLAVYSILDRQFSTCFGFTEVEVQRLLQDASLSDKEQEVKHWYNGYHFGGGVVIYNPWSILNYISRSEDGFRPYWLGTSGNDLTYELIQEGTGVDFLELEQLIKGVSLRKRLYTNVGMRDLSTDSIWNLLLFTGYLTAQNYQADSEMADLSIPNFEVQLFYRDTVSLWFGQASSPDTLVASLLQERLADFARGLAEAVKSILSFHDTGGTTPERIYHIFVVGMMLHLRDRYRIESNRESGGGRADLMLLPRKPGATGFLFEFKAATKGDLKKLSQTALTQVADQDYASSFREAGASKLIVLGLAVRGKRIALASYSEDLTSGKRSQTQEFSEGTEIKAPKEPKPKPKPEERAPSDMDPQKLMMIGQIQLLQEQKGQTILSLETMISADIKFLGAMLETLKGL